MHHLFVALYRHIQHIFPVLVTALRRHRLLVVLPVFLVILAISFRGSHMSGALVKQDASEDPLGPVSASTQIAIGGMHGILAPGGIVMRQADALPRLIDGTLLIHSDGLIEFAAGNFSVLGWSGGFSMTMQKDTVTIAALTTPVLVRDGDAILLIPVRSQWKGHGLAPYKDSFTNWLKPRALQSVPDSFIERQQELLHKLPVEPHAALTTSDSFSTMLSFLRLPASDTRAEEQESSQAMMELLSLLQSDGKEEILSLAEKGAIAGILTSVPAKPFLPLFLQKAAEQGMTSWFLPAFLNSENHVLLASIHPALAASVWTTPSDAKATTEGTLLRILMLPIADTLSEGGNDLMIERWGETLKEFLADQTDPQALLKDLLPQLQSSIQRADALGYPLRAKHYARAVINATSKWQEHLSGKAKEALTQLEVLAHRPQPPVESLSTSSAAAQGSSIASAAASSVALFSEDDIRARTQAALEQAGALFTSKTEIIPIDGRNAAHVSNIAFATAKGDLLVEFSYDVDRGIVFNVTQDGVPLPYDVPLQVYVEWLHDSKQ